MKKLTFCLACTILTIAACVREENLEIHTDDNALVYGHIEENTGTRTSLNEDLDVVWSPEDKILVFRGSTLRRKYLVTSESVGLTDASFTRDNEYEHIGKGSEISGNIAFYPFCEAICSQDGNSYTLSGVTLPAVQKYTDEGRTFETGLFPMMAVTKDTDDLNFGFKNLCGALKLQILGTANVKTLVLQGNSGELLSGEAAVTGYSDNSSPAIEMKSNASGSVSLDCGTGVQLNENTPSTFIIVTPPVEFKTGFTVTVTTVDGQTATLSTQKKNTVYRSSLLTMPETTLEFSSQAYGPGDYFDEYGINHGKGTEIDGVVWAPVNCGYHAEHYPWGKLYQWGRKWGQGYYDAEYSDATVPTTAYAPLDMHQAQSKVYENTFYNGTNFDWQYSHGQQNGWMNPRDINYWKYDPCPEGWRVPTDAELYGLMTNQSVWTVENGVTGHWHSGSVSYSESVPRVFLPSAGTRDSKGNAFDRCSEGYYWTNLGIGEGYAVAFYFTTSGKTQHAVSHLAGASVRCVSATSQNDQEMVSEITVNESSLSMEVHSRATLTASVSPNNATSKNVFWDTDDPSVVTVDSNGNVTAVGEGKANLTASIGARKASCAITVVSRTAHKGDYIDEYGINHGPGFTYGGITWAPVNCGYRISAGSGQHKSYQWGRKYGYYSAKEKIDGPVSLAVGQSAENDGIYISSFDADWLDVSLDDLWNMPGGSKSEYDPCPEGWKVPTLSEMESLEAGAVFIQDNDRQGLLCGNMFLPRTLYWTSSYQSESANAYAIITEYYDCAAIEINRSSGCTIRCIRAESAQETLKPVTSIYINKSSLTLAGRETAVLKAAISPSDATHSTVVWSSDNPIVANVDNNGNVTARNEGTAVITAMAGMKTARCTVTVTPDPYAVHYIDEYGIDRGTGTEVDGVIWAPVNCGYDTGKFPFGKLYQWGRLYGQGYSDGVYSDAELPEVKDRRIYPDEQTEADANVFFIGSSSDYSWSYYDDNTLWNKGTSVKPVKGAYDPCPDGWRVPTEEELTGLTANFSSKADTFDGQSGGWFSGSRPSRENEARVFLPLAGSRLSTGTAAKREEYGFYWSSGSYLSIDNSLGSLYAYNNAYITKANGYSLRCVQEDPDAKMIPVTSLSIGTDNLTLKPAQEHSFVCTVLPSDATDRKVRWSSADPYVASVDAYGRVTAHMAGTTTVSARAGACTATCEVTVEVEYKDERYIDVYGIDHGEGTNIDGRIWAPVNCGYHSADFQWGRLYQWGRRYGQGYTGYDAISPVSAEGPVSLEEGQKPANRNTFFKVSQSPYHWMDIHDASLWNSGTEEHPVKTQYDPCPEGWRVPTKTELEGLMANKSAEVTVNGQKGYRYSGSSIYSDLVPALFLPHCGTHRANETDSYGRNSWGTYHTSSSTYDSAYANALRCIKDTDKLADIPVTGLTVTTSLRLAEGASQELETTVYPYNATDQALTFSSSDPDVAIVDQNGSVTGVSKGTAVITVSCGGKSADCTVNIWEMIDYISLEGVNYGKGVYINGLAWAPENEYDYFSYWEDFANACPSGWRLPTEIELKSLMIYGKGFNYSGTTPYSEGVTTIYLPPKGRYNMDKDAYQFVGDYAYFWASDTYGGWRAFVYGIEDGGGYYESDNGLYKLSVRCVQE